MKKIMVGIRETFGKTACVFFGIFLLLCFFVFLMMSGDDVYLLVCAIFSFLCSILLFAASTDAYLEDTEEVSVPFFHSLDENGNHIMTNGKTTIIVEDREPEKTSTDDITSIEREIILFEMELEEEGKEVTPYRKLKFLKGLFSEYRMDLEEYKKQKKMVFAIELDKFFSGIDLQEYDEKKAAQRKLRSIQELFRDNLIDTDEYEELKTEILEESSEL